MRQTSTRRRIVLLVTALAVASAVAFSFTLVQFHGLAGFAEAVNKSGSQRMRTILLGSLAEQSYRTLLEEELFDTSLSSERAALRSEAETEHEIYTRFLQDIKDGEWPDEIGVMISAWESRWNSFSADLEIVQNADERSPVIDSAAHRIGVLEANALRKEIHQIVTAIQEQSDSTLSRISTSFTVVIALVIVLSFAVVVTVYRALMPLSALTRHIHEFGDGDLGVCIESSRTDEIGSLMSDFANAVGSIRTLVSNVQESAVASEAINSGLAEQLEESLGAASTISGRVEHIETQFASLASSIQSASAAMEKINAIADSFKRRAEEQSSAVTQTTSSMEQMSTSIQNVNRIADERVEYSEKLRESTEAGSRALERTLDLTRSIGERMDGILDLITVINNVAAQTNLLAMNAAIEAAHAGDAGRGFAVVADEIRKLAESTSSSAGEISRTIKDLAANANEVVDANAATGEAFESIRSGVTESTDSFKEIVESMQALTVASRDVVNAAEDLLRIAGEIRGRTGEMKSGADEVGSMLTGITGAASEVQAGMATIKSEAARVNLIAGTIGDTAQKNLSELANLFSQLGQFTVSSDHTVRQSVATQRVEISTIILDHAGWVAKARAVLDGTMSIDPATVADHTGCSLGQWLSGPGRAVVGDGDSFTHIDTAHRELHRALTTIVQGRETCERATLEEEFERLIAASRAVVDGLSELRDGRTNLAG